MPPASWPTPATISAAAIHLLARLSVFSDSLPGGGGDALTWTAALDEGAGALAFGAVAAHALRRPIKHALW